MAFVIVTWCLLLIQWNSNEINAYTQNSFDSVAAALSSRSLVLVSFVLFRLLSENKYILWQNCIDRSESYFSSSRSFYLLFLVFNVSSSLAISLFFYAFAHSHANFNSIILIILQTAHNKNEPTNKMLLVNVSEMKSSKIIATDKISRANLILTDWLIIEPFDWNN